MKEDPMTTTVKEEKGEAMATIEVATTEETIAVEATKAEDVTAMEVTGVEVTVETIGVISAEEVEAIQAAAEATIKRVAADLEAEVGALAVSHL